MTDLIIGQFNRHLHPNDSALGRNVFFVIINQRHKLYRLDAIIDNSAFDGLNSDKISYLGIDEAAYLWLSTAFKNIFAMERLNSIATLASHFALVTLKRL